MFQCFNVFVFVFVFGGCLIVRLAVGIRGSELGLGKRAGLGLFIFVYLAETTMVLGLEHVPCLWSNP